MRLADFDYDLPDDLIARYPGAERRASRLLVVDPAAGELADRRFADLPQLIEVDDLLVFNDTRVIKARLRGHKVSGGSVEILIERQLGEREALAQLRASRTPRVGSRLVLAGGGSALVRDRRDDLFHLEFADPLLPFLDTHGEIPLPPYLERPAEPLDETRYQTVYARAPGAVAAPTAGLHFDRLMLDELAKRGVRHVFVTLHVGAGTFQSLRAENVDENRLHGERVEVGADVCDAIAETRSRGGRVIAVGTTSVRALETAAGPQGIAPVSGETELFIRPGHEFRAVDAMLTNFHLPRSSLLMLVAAFGGHERMLDAYRHAVLQRYRFFSYGDAMLIRSRDPER